MTDVIARRGVEPTLRARGPAYTVMQECLSIQDEATPRGRFAALLGATPLDHIAAPWYRGALGELEVTRVLSALGPEWMIIHSVPVGADESDIDHVVIGPAGVFTIDIRNHSGRRVVLDADRFVVDGHRTSHIADSTSEATRAARLLADRTDFVVRVTPLIVVIDPKAITRITEPNVDVVTVSGLAKYLASQVPLLSDATLARLSFVAEQRETWAPQTEVVEDPARVLHRFERLRSDVAAATARQRLVIGLVSAAALLVGSLSIFAAIVSAA